VRKYEFCIGGYAGCGNVGDDAILQGYLGGLSADQRQFHTVVLSGNPRRDSRRFDVKCIGRKNLFSVTRCLMQSKFFLCGGGSLLQNATGNFSLLYYLGLLWLARLCGCKTRLMASGIGPLGGKFAQRIVIWTLRGCEQIEVRDRESERFLLEHGINREKVRLVRDPATELELPSASRLFFLKREMGIAIDREYFCVVVRRDQSPWGSCLGKISAGVRLFLREQNLLPVFVVFDAKNDLTATEQVCRSVGGVILRPREARDALSVISGGCFLVSMRLHALVFASMVNVCAVGISPFDRETKLAAFCRENCMAHRSPSELTVAGLFEELVRLGKDQWDCQM